MVTRSVVRPLVILLGTISLVVAGISAQIPGQNINIVSKDPHLAKQNEPSGAMGTLNPCHLLFGANDYRTVHLPGLSADKEVGDAWVGVYQSTDCGQTWMAGLMPGYPQDQSPEGLASPASEFGAAADPTVRAGLAGFYAYSYIVFDRGANPGKLLLSRFIDPNNNQVAPASITSSDPVQIPIEKWPIQYVGPTLVVEGNAGQFLDKPHMTVSPGPGTCDLPYKELDHATGAYVTKVRSVPATVVHLVWTTFLNNAPKEDGKVLTRVNYNRSSNCGASLDGPTRKLSETYLVNQGASISISPTTGEIFVTWRSFSPDFSTSQLLFARSTDGGEMFTAPSPVPSFSGISFFDQNTSTNPPRFRTIAYPTTAFDHNGTLHLAVAVRMNNVPQRSARILYTTWNGETWSSPSAVAPSAGPEHQIMPALTYAAGKLQMIWYDFVDDASRVFTQDVNDGHVYGAGPRVRHTVDVRGAEGNFGPNGDVTFSAYGVQQIPELWPAAKISQYLMGTNTGPAGPGPLQLLQSNRTNLKLYCGGECPFIGDYIDMAGLQFVPQLPEASPLAAPAPPPDPGGTKWVFNGPATANSFAREFHAVWTDNRDAIVDSVFADTVDGVIPYTSVHNATGGKNPLCNPAFTKSRNANIYTSRITPGISLLLPVNAKPLDAAVTQRSFPFAILNGTTTQQSVTVAIANQPAGGVASFAQFSSLSTIVVDIPARSSAARTVFVTSSARFPPIRLVATAGPGLNAAVVINPDPTNPGPVGTLAAEERHDPVIANPDLDNPDLDNPDLDNPDLDNPDLDNPDLDNPDLDNPDLDNPDLDNPDLDNPDLDNPDLDNAALAEVSDTSYELTNTGNDAAVYQVDVDVSGRPTDKYLFQLFSRRVYKLPSAKGCEASQTGQNQILFNIVSPDTTVGGFQDPNSRSAKNATVLLLPGEAIKLTLRVRPKTTKTQKFCPFADADGGCTSKTTTHTVVVKVRAQAANTGDTVPKGATFGQK